MDRLQEEGESSQVFQCLRKLSRRLFGSLRLISCLCGGGAAGDKTTHRCGADVPEASAAFWFLPPDQMDGWMDGCIGLGETRSRAQFLGSNSLAVLMYGPDSDIVDQKIVVGQIGLNLLFYPSELKLLLIYFF